MPMFRLRPLARLNPFTVPSPWPATFHPRNPYTANVQPDRNGHLVGNGFFYGANEHIQAAPGPFPVMGYPQGVGRPLTLVEPFAAAHPQATVVPMQKTFVPNPDKVLVMPPQHTFQPAGAPTRLPGTPASSAYPEQIARPLTVVGSPNRSSTKHDLILRLPESTMKTWLDKLVEIVQQTGCGDSKSDAASRTGSNAGPANITATQIDPEIKASSAFPPLPRSSMTV